MELIQIPTLSQFCSMLQLQNELNLVNATWYLCCERPDATCRGKGWRRPIGTEVTCHALNTAQELYVYEGRYSEGGKNTGKEEAGKYFNYQIQVHQHLTNLFNNVMSQ